MNKQRCFPFWCIFLFLLISGAYANKYEMQDLEVNAKNGNYLEFFRHARDIRPSKRGKQWVSMVKSTSEQLFSAIEASPILRPGQINTVKTISRWPVFKNHQPFHLRFYPILLRSIQSCMDKNREKQNDRVFTLCLKPQLEYWDPQQADLKSSFSLAKMIAPLDQLWYLPSAKSMWKDSIESFLGYLLQNNLKSGLSDFYCQQELSQRVLWDRLSRLTKKSITPAQFDTDMSKYWNRLCWKNFKQVVIENFNRLSGPQRETFYQVLPLDQTMAQKDKDLLYLFYLLDNPSSSPTFNLAWGNLSRLSLSVERREQVMKKIKAMDPLPDRLFSIKDQKKKTVILRNLDRRIPELIRFYSSTCKQYLTGSGEFPNGNPTANCKEFTKLFMTVNPEKILSVSPEKISELAKILRINKI